MKHKRKHRRGSAACHLCKPNKHPNAAPTAVGPQPGRLHQEQRADLREQEQRAEIGGSRE